MKTEMKMKMKNRTEKGNQGQSVYSASKSALVGKFHRNKKTLFLLLFLSCI